MNNCRLLILFRTALMLLSLLATFSFLMGMGNGVTALLFAIAGTVTQAAALLFLPRISAEAWQSSKLATSICSVTALGLVVLMSVFGSTSILSDFAGESAKTAELHEALVQQAQSHQDSANRLIALDRITQAQPILAKAAELTAQASALPQPSGFYQAAQRVGGDQTETIVTTVIVMISVLLDAITLLLGNVTGVTPPLVSAPQYQQDSNTVTVENIERVTCRAVSHPDVALIHAAVSNGEIPSISVRNVRAALKCSQRHATEITRLCQLANNQLNLI